MQDDRHIKLNQSSEVINYTDERRTHFLIVIGENIGAGAGVALLVGSIYTVTGYTVPSWEMLTAIGGCFTGVLCIVRWGLDEAVGAMGMINARYSEIRLREAYAELQEQYRLLYQLAESLDSELAQLKRQPVAVDVEVTEFKGTGSAAVDAFPHRREAVKYARTLYTSQGAINHKEVMETGQIKRAVLGGYRRGQQKQNALDFLMSRGIIVKRKNNNNLFLNIDRYPFWQQVEQRLN